MENNCDKCTLEDTERMVQCDSCDKWFHFECVDVTSDVAYVCWSCDSCGMQQPALLKTTTTTQTLPMANATNDFLVGVQASSTASGQKQLKESTTHVQAAVVAATIAAATGAYKKVSTNTNAMDSSRKLSHEIQSSPKTSNTDSNVLNNNKNNLPVQQQKLNTATIGDLTASDEMELQLQFLEEEKELQRQYLMKKYKILSQGCTNASSFSSFQPSAFSSFQPSSYQIAARQVIPKDLPHFDGNPEDWPLFISNFKTSTQIAGYSDGENLMRLQSCLRGRAKELVKCKLLVPSMVNEIIQTLEMCFGRPEHILDNMIEKVVKINPLKDKLDSLIEYALVVRNICSTMEACDMTAHLSNPMLVKTLVDKLPNSQKLSWAMYIKDDKVPVVKSFSDWLYAIAAAASQVVTPVCTKKSGCINTHQQSINNNKSSCFSCKGSDHKIQNCDEFKSLVLDRKWTIVKDNKLCRHCLNLHRRKCYNNNKECGINGCTAKHHQLLHNHSTFGNSTSATSNTGQRGENVNAHNDNNQDKPCFRILLVRIHSNNNSFNTFAFLDEGSSVTLMEQHVFDMLNLNGKN